MPRLSSILVGIMVVALIGPACGTRQSHDAITAAARASATSANPAGAGRVTDASGDDIGVGNDASSAGSASGTAIQGAGATAARAAGGERRASGERSSRGSELATAPTKAPITIGSLGTISGIVGNAVAPIVTAVRVWVRDVNDHGGLNGHRVNIVVADDGGDPARNRALAQEFVETRKVIAFVGNPGVVTGRSSFEYLKSKRVPVIGSDTGGDYFYDAATYFPQASSGYQLLQGVGGSALEGRSGQKVGVVVCVEAQICTDQLNYFPKVARSYRNEVVYSARVSLTQPDFTAECLNAARSGAQIVVFSLDGNTIERFAASCARQNYHPLFVWGASATNDGMLRDRNLDGAMSVITVAPWMLDNTPTLREFRHAMSSYGGGLGAAQITGWAAAKLFEAAGRDLPEPPTRDALLDGLWSIKNNDLGGITQPLTFEREKPAPRATCWWTVLIKNGAFVSPDSGRRHCAPVIPK